MSAEHAEPPRAAELRSLIERSGWLVDLLDTVRMVGVPQGWIGAGVIRDVVWGQRFSGPDADASTKDVDVVFFDERDLSRDLDQLVERQLTRHRPGVAWDAKNQAAVHLWYAARFGVHVQPFASIPEAVATWPEFAVCVAARISSRRRIEICAPHGLDDLLDGVWRRNPARVTVDEYIRRLASKHPASRWPGIRVLD